MADMPLIVECPAGGEVRYACSVCGRAHSPSGVVVIDGLWACAARMSCRDRARTLTAGVSAPPPAPIRARKPRQRRYVREMLQAPPAPPPRRPRLPYAPPVPAPPPAETRDALIRLRQAAERKRGK